MEFLKNSDLNKLYKAIITPLTPVNQVVFGLVLAGLFWAVFCSSEVYYKKQSDALLLPWRHADSIRLSSILPFRDSTFQTQTLISQYVTMDSLKEHHIRVSSIYYKNYYTFATVLTLFGVLAALGTFLIIKYGWDNQTPFVNYIRIFFTFCASVTTLMIGYTQVYKLEGNINDNMQRYFAYEKQQIDVHTSFVTPVGWSFKDKRKQLQLDSMIHVVNNTIKNNRGLFMDMDVEKVPNTLRNTDNLSQ